MIAVAPYQERYTVAMPPRVLSPHEMTWPHLRFWLPVLGPSTVCTLLALEHLRRTAGDVGVVSATVTELRELTGLNATHLQRALQRAVAFDLGLVQAIGSLIIPRNPPTLAYHHRLQLAPALRAEYERSFVVH